MPLKTKDGVVEEEEEEAEEEEEEVWERERPKSSWSMVANEKYVIFFTRWRSREREREILWNGKSAMYAYIYPHVPLFSSLASLALDLPQNPYS